MSAALWLRCCNPIGWQIPPGPLRVIGFAEAPFFLQVCGFSWEIGIAFHFASRLNRGLPNVFELFQAAISPHQILLTLLLALVVCYWLLVILGALDFDTDLPDADVNVDSDGHHAHKGMSTGGAWFTLGRIFGFTQVPLVVWLSFMVLFLWFYSLLSNHLWNPSADRSRALLLLLPILIATVITTRLITHPIALVFKAMNDTDSEAEEVIGRVGIVCSMEADETYGQLQITGQGAPLLINVRTAAGVPALKKGEQAKVLSAGPDNTFYHIEPIL